jgi:hypothetical protein
MKNSSSGTVNVKSSNSDKVLDSGPFERLFSGNAVAKILDFLISSQQFDYSEADIARYSGVSSKTVQREIPKLVGTKLVKQSRTVGNAKMYQLDKDNTNKEGTGYLADRLSFALASEEIHKLLPEEQEQKITI